MELRTCAARDCDEQFLARGSGPTEKRFHSKKCFHRARLGADWPKEPRICAARDCDEEFVPLRKNQKFHSTECQVRANNGKDAPPEIRTCEARDCNEQFPASGTKRFCSGRCSRRAYYGSDVPPVIKTCEARDCDETFVAESGKTGPKARFHSKACADRANKGTDYPKEMQTCAARNCDETFMPINRRNIFHSDECQDFEEAARRSDEYKKRREERQEARGPGPNTTGGYCECGCGGLAPIATYNCATYGYVKGKPIRFIHHHWNMGEATRRGEAIANWKGGVAKSSHGYITILHPDLERDELIRASKQAGSYIFVHRLTACLVLNRPLPKSEVVHHVDENKHNNDPRNLWVFPNQASHASWHQTINREAKANPDLDYHTVRLRIEEDSPPDVIRLSDHLDDAAIERLVTALEKSATITTELLSWLEEDAA